MQVHINRGIAKQIWLNKPSFLTQTVDYLGDIFCPTLHAAWLAYIKETYPVHQPVKMATVSAGAFIDDKNP